MISAILGAMAHALEAIHAHVKDMDALPPWWHDGMSPFKNFPDMYGEIE